MQDISGTSSLFVFLFGIALTTFFPKLGREAVSPRNLMQKGVAALFILAGAVLIGEPVL